MFDYLPGIQPGCYIYKFFFFYPLQQTIIFIIFFPIILWSESLLPGLTQQRLWQHQALVRKESDMKIAIFGASGTIGSAISREALERGHKVTAIVRDPSRITSRHQALQVVKGDILDTDQAAKLVAGHDVVVNATGPRQPDDKVSQAVEAARSLLKMLRQANVSRLLVVGGAGSLEVAPGVQLVDTPQFPPSWKGIALAHREALALYRTAASDWTYISPAAMIGPGNRTGKYRTGNEQLLTDEKGESNISVGDFAAAFVDEIEKGEHKRQRITFAY